MRPRLLIICCLFFIIGCKNKNRIPAGVIPQKKMQAIVWDMMRADQFLTDFVLSKDSSLDKRTESIKLYTKVFAIHQISKEQYEQSFSFYKKHPALLIVIMDSISRPKTEAPTEMIRQNIPGDSFQQPPRKPSQADSFIQLPKKKVRTRIKTV